MTKKLYGVLIPLLAMVAFVGVPAAAQAAPHWYKEGTRLPFTEAKTGIVMSGALKFESSNGIVVECEVLGGGDVFNKHLAENGAGGIEALSFYRCSSAQCPTSGYNFLKLPYTTELTEHVSGTIRDAIKITELLVNCAGTSMTFTGTLEPKVVNGTSKTAPTALEFGAGSGVLNGPSGVDASWEGRIKFEGEEQELITAKNP